MNNQAKVEKGIQATVLLEYLNNAREKVRLRFETAAESGDMARETVDQYIADLRAFARIKDALETVIWDGAVAARELEKEQGE